MKDKNVCWSCGSKLHTISTKMQKSGKYKQKFKCSGCDFELEGIYKQPITI